MYRHGIVTIQSEETAGSIKSCTTEPRSPEIPENLIGLHRFPVGNFREFCVSQKRFSNIKMRHRQSQTMFGWTTRFYEAMIFKKKYKNKSSNICLLFIFVSHFLF
jgi:hypothetical protein